MNDLFGDAMTLRVILWIILVLSLTVHEWARLQARLLLGDDTAKQMGRVTLNPIAHIDPDAVTAAGSSVWLGEAGAGQSAPVPS
ncbi:MAG: hypothetical protein R3B90_16305 [Planctomycetaceae bacterium]